MHNGNRNFPKSVFMYRASNFNLMEYEEYWRKHYKVQKIKHHREDIQEIRLNDVVTFGVDVSGHWIDPIRLDKSYIMSQLKMWDKEFLLTLQTYEQKKVMISILKTGIKDYKDMLASILDRIST